MKLAYVDITSGTLNGVVNCVSLQFLSMKRIERFLKSYLTSKENIFVFRKQNSVQNHTIII